MVVDHLIWVVPFIALADALITLFVHIQSIRAKKSIKNGIESLHRSVRDVYSQSGYSSSGTRSIPSQTEKIDERGYDVKGRQGVEEVGRVEEVEMVERRFERDGVTISSRGRIMSNCEIDV